MTPRKFAPELVWLPLVLAAVLLIYVPGLDNAPVFDDAYLADGTLFAEYRSWTDLRARMLSYGSFVWLKELFGDGWWKQRALNVALHVGVVLALWALYREILTRIEPPPPEVAGSHEAPPPLHRAPALGIAIAFFALNPVAVYAVAYLIQRSIVMATFFTVIALWAFARGVLRSQWPYFVVAFFSYALAVLSKEHAVLAPLVALPLYVLIARPTRRRLAAITAGVAAVMGAAAWVLALRYGRVIGQPFDEFSRVYLAQLAALDPRTPERAYALSIINQCWLFLEYGLRWMLPYAGWMSINLRPPFPLTWLTFPQILGVAGYLGALVGGTVLLLRFRDWKALLGLSLLIPAILFATEFLTVWVQDPLVLYRSYLWAIGVPGVVYCLFNGASRRAAFGIGLAVGAFLAYQSLDRVFSLQNPESAWSDAIAKLPDDPRSVGRWFPYLNRGSAYVDRDELALALNDFQRSSKLGDMGMGAFNSGAVLAAQGRHAEALAAFDRAEKEGYDLYNLPIQRGLSLMATGKAVEAYRQFEAARARKPPSPTMEQVLLNMGRAALQINMVDEAIKDLETLVRIDPEGKDGRYLLGMAYVTKGDNARAIPLFDRLLAEGPSVPAYYGRALAHFQARRKPEALADVERAIRGDPANPRLRQLQARIQQLP
ncbi:MAG TPA: tetratricopeptide repeat protein [Usitatibacter sp.]|nr:tetratricopeptide repeat protein [Usitatibacter sp.]